MYTEGELRQIVLTEDGKANWDGIRDKFFEYRRPNVWAPSLAWIRDYQVKTWEIFRKEGILSSDRNQNYLIMGHEALLNPRCWPSLPLFFTEKEDALLYLELNDLRPKQTIYIIKCEVCHIKWQRR